MRLEKTQPTKNQPLLFPEYVQPEKQLDRVQIDAYFATLRASNEAGCGCIPMIPNTTLPPWVKIIDKSQNKPDGYITLKDKNPVYKSDIEASYNSTWTGRPRERNFENLDRFIDEITTLLGEDKTKANVIFEGLRGKPQAQMQTLLAAYEKLMCAYIAKAGKLRIQDNGTRDVFQKKIYYQTIWSTFLQLTNRDFIVNDTKLISIVDEVRPDQTAKVREKLNGMVNRVALALWIAKEKAKAG